MQTVESVTAASAGRGGVAGVGCGGVAAVGGLGIDSWEEGQVRRRTEPRGEEHEDAEDTAQRYLGTCNQ